MTWWNNLDFDLKKAIQTNIIWTICGLLAFIAVHRTIGNPIKDIFLLSFTKIVIGKIEDVYDFEIDTEEGSSNYIGFSYSYKIDYQLYEKVVDGDEWLNNEYNLVSPIDDEKGNPLKIEYVTFYPSISKVSGSGYSGISFFLISILLKTSIYVLIAIMYTNLTKENFQIIRMELKTSKK